MVQSDYRFALDQGSITQAEYVDLLATQGLWDEDYAQSIMNAGSGSFVVRRAPEFQFFDPSYGMIW